jgi:hypothetical protein
MSYEANPEMDNGSEATTGGSVYNSYWKMQNGAAYAYVEGALILALLFTILLLSGVLGTPSSDLMKYVMWADIIIGGVYLFMEYSASKGMGGFMSSLMGRPAGLVI